MIVPAPAAARAVARSPSRCASDWYAHGATRRGKEKVRAEDRRRRVGPTRSHEGREAEAPPVERASVLCERPLVTGAANVEVVDIGREPLARGRFVVVNGHDRVVPRPAARSLTRPSASAPCGGTAGAHVARQPSARLPHRRDHCGRRTIRARSRSTGPTTPMAPAGSPRWSTPGEAISASPTTAS